MASPAAAVEVGAAEAAAAGNGGAAVDDLQHLPPARLPLALAELHRRLPVGGRLALALAGDAALMADLVRGAGFDVDHVSVTENAVKLEAVRQRTLPDVVGPRMRVLVCGLNPSLYAADAGVGYARPGNRFWPAALAAGLVSVDRDPWHALRHHGVGFTDLVKRATVGAAELTPAEFRAGVERLGRLCARLGPKVVACCGLSGWRAAVDPRAGVGWHERRLGGAAVYVLPNPSGRNTHTSLAELTAHLSKLAAAVAP
ncbi:MAG: mismatch-specific DNA-glycosylase [Acidimicrobiales bacterium]